MTLIESAVPRCLQNRPLPEWTISSGQPQEDKGGLTPTTVGYNLHDDRQYYIAVTPPDGHPEHWNLEVIDFPWFIEKEPAKREGPHLIVSFKVCSHGNGFNGVKLLADSNCKTIEARLSHTNGRTSFNLQIPVVLHRHVIKVTFALLSLVGASVVSTAFKLFLIPISWMWVVVLAALFVTLTLGASWWFTHIHPRRAEDKEKKKRLQQLEADLEAKPLL